MLLCFVNAGFGWNVSVVAGAADCVSGFVAQSASTFVANTGTGSSGGSFDITALSTLFNSYFQFDATIFEMILGFNMVAFVTGYSIRRVVRLLST
jgi:hypothetical protein